MGLKGPSLIITAKGGVLLSYLLRNEKGGVNSIEFIIYFAIIVFMMFTGIDYYVAQVRHSLVEQAKEQALDRMRIEGWLTTEAQEQIRGRLENMGYSDIQFDGTVQGIISSPVTRNVKNSEISTVSLIITCKPREVPFLLGRLVGASDGGEFVIRVGGEALSERPN